MLNNIFRSYNLYPATHNKAWKAKLEVQRTVAMEMIHRLILLHWCKLQVLRTLQNGSAQVVASFNSPRCESLVWIRFNSSLLSSSDWSLIVSTAVRPTSLPPCGCMQAGQCVKLCVVGGCQLGMCNATLCPTRSQRCPQHTDEQRRAVRVFLLGPSAWVPFLTPSPPVIMTLIVQVFDTNHCFLIGLLLPEIERCCWSVL